MSKSKNNKEEVLLLELRKKVNESFNENCLPKEMKTPWGIDPLKRSREFADTIFERLIFAIEGGNEATLAISESSDPYVSDYLTKAEEPMRKFAEIYKKIKECRIDIERVDKYHVKRFCWIYDWQEGTKIFLDLLKVKWSKKEVQAQHYDWKYWYQKGVCIIPEVLVHKLSYEGGGWGGTSIYLSVNIPEFDI